MAGKKQSHLPGKGRAFRKFLYFLFIFYFILLIVSPFIKPGYFSIISLGIGLIWPLMFSGFIIFLWLLIRKWRLLFWIGNLLILVVGVFTIRTQFAVHFFSKPQLENRGIKIISWNVSRWDERNKEKRGGVSYRDAMLDFLAKEGADILCLQEFFECKNPKFFQSTEKVLIDMGYVYSAFYPHHSLFDSTFLYGLAVFSRFPIQGSEWRPNNLGIHSEGAMYADVKTNIGVIRVFNSHLESYGLHGDVGGYIKSSEAFNNTRNQIQEASRKRYLQARNLRKWISESPYEYILACDLGELPNSISYQTLRNGNKDTFLEKGKGFGGTYSSRIPTTRIDYLIGSQRIMINSFSTKHLKYSDHYPLILSMELN